jgi:peroxiredoxin
VSHAVVPWTASVAVVLLALLGLGLPVAHGAGTYTLLGRKAPDFALHGVNGHNVRLSEHLGEVVVISFWNSRCISCWAQLRSLDRSLDTYHAAGLSMYGISVDDDPRTAAAAASKAGELALALLVDPQKSVARAYDIDSLPTTLLIDRSGTIRYVMRDFSARGEAAYLAQLRSLLDE